MGAANQWTLIWSPQEVTGFCGLYPEFEKSQGNHVLALEKAGCSGCSFPSLGTMEEKY